MEPKNTPSVTEPVADAVSATLSEDRRREIRAMSAAQIETRRAEIREAVQTADADALDAFEAELSAMETRARELDALETRRKAVQSIVSGGGTVIAQAPAVTEKRSLESVIASEAYLNAFANDIKHNTDRECRALLSDLVTGGQIPVPTYISERVQTAWEKMPVLPRIRRTQIPGVAKYPFEYSADEAVNHAEGTAAPAEENVQLGSVSVTPAMRTKWISYSKETEILTGRAYVDYIFDEIEYRILKKCEDDFIQTVLDAPAAMSLTTVSVSALTPSAFDAATIFNAQAPLSSAATNPVVIMHRQTYFNVFMALADTTGRPIYNVVQENGKPSYYLNGLPVLFSDKLARGANAQIIVGDLDGAVCNLPRGYGVEFVRDDITLAAQSMIKIIGSMYVGFGLIRPGHFTKVTLTPAASGGSGGNGNSGG